MFLYTLLLHTVGYQWPKYKRVGIKNTCVYDIALLGLIINLSVPCNILTNHYLPNNTKIKDENKTEKK